MFVTKQTITNFCIGNQCRSYSFRVKKYWVHAASLIKLHYTYNDGITYHTKQNYSVPDFGKHSSVLFECK